MGGGGAGAQKCDAGEMQKRKDQMLKCRTSMGALVSAVSGTPRIPSYRIGTLRTTEFAPWTASAAISPARFVFP